MPEGFLCADSILRLSENVISGLNVHEKVIDRLVREQLPFIAMEDIMMEAVKKGGDRQEIHEVLRKYAMDYAACIAEGEPFDIVGMLAEDKMIGMTMEEINAIMRPERYTGRSSEQVSRYVEKVRPLLTDNEREKEDILI